MQDDFGTKNAAAALAGIKGQAALGSAWPFQNLRFIRSIELLKVPLSSIYSLHSGMACVLSGQDSWYFDAKKGTLPLVEFLRGRKAAPQLT